VLTYVDIDLTLLPTLERLWPGPLTIVAPLKKEIGHLIPPQVTAGLQTLAVRIPRHPTFLELIRRVGPLAAPSANLSGLPSSTRSWHIESDYHGQVPIVEGDIPEFGVESTILIQKEGFLEIGRLGATPIDSLKEFFSIQEGDDTINCPGKLFKHYSPHCHLTTKLTENVQAIVGFHDKNYPSQPLFYNLGARDDPRMIASRLFETLRLLDLDKITLAYVDTDFPHRGLYTTIHERLSRALKANKESYV